MYLQIELEELSKKYVMINTNQPCIENFCSSREALLATGESGIVSCLGVKRFHSYLFGRHFVISNDHKPLEGMLHEDKPVPPMAFGRIRRWALALSAYDYLFKYKSDDKLGNADATSRLPLPQLPTDVPLPAEIICLLEFINSSPIDVEMIKHWTDKDPLLS